MSDFGEGRTIKTRKPHRCSWCGQAIEIGDAYHYKGMWQNEWQDWYMHPECQEVYRFDGDEDGFSPFENERPTVTSGLSEAGSA